MCSPHYIIIIHRFNMYQNVLHILLGGIIIILKQNFKCLIEEETPLQRYVGVAFGYTDLVLGFPISLLLQNIMTSRILKII